jgi:hypothetical protein
MTFLSATQPQSLQQVIQGAADQSQGAPLQPPQDPQNAQDSTQISTDPKPQQSATLEKLKGWLKKAVESSQKELTPTQKCTRFALSTAIGAGSGAAMIATGTAPVVSAIVGTALGAVTFGGLGLFAGFMIGMIMEKSGKKDAMGKGSMTGLVSGGLIGAGIGGVSGWAQGHLLVAAANLCGGGPLGGAIAGGVIAALSALPALLKKSPKENHGQDPSAGGQTPPQTPPAPAPQPGQDPAQVKP